MTIEDIHATLVQLNMISVLDSSQPPKPLPGQTIKFPKGRKNGIARKHLQRTQTHDDEKANRIAEKLIAAGAVTSEADENLLTIFHRAIYSGRPSLVSTFLKADPNARVVLTVPWMDTYSTAIFPIVSAVNGRAYSVLAILLAHGAKLTITRDDFQRARDTR